jgi:hypothetical protein
MSLDVIHHICTTIGNSFTPNVSFAVAFVSFNEFSM